MCAQYVAKHSLHPAVLASTEIFIEDNNQTLRLPLLRQPRIRDVVILENGCVSYIHVDNISFLLYIE